MSNLSLVNKIESVVIQGDLAKLSPDERVNYYKNVCESVGLNPLTKPFDYITLNGRLVLYGNKGCAEQLRHLHSISIKIVDKQKIDDVYVVTAEATGKDGRADSSTGAVNIANLKGDALANAIMKAETKAKRRVTLSICGLNMLDESEVETLVNEPSKEKTTTPYKHELTKDVDPSKFIPTFGKFKGKTLESLDIFELQNYVDHLNKEKGKHNNKVNSFLTEFLIAAEAFLNSRDVSLKK